MTAPDKAFEEWMKGYYVEHGFISSKAEMQAAWLASRKEAQDEVRELLDASYEIVRMAHRTDLPDIADDGGSDMHGTYRVGAWTRFRNAVAALTQKENPNG